MTKPEDIYKQQLLNIGVTLKKHQKQKTLFGWARLVAMLLAVAAFWHTWSTGEFGFLSLAFLFMGCFLFILKKDLQNNEAIETLLRLQKINETEIDILGHKFSHLPDSAGFELHVHDYAKDLDIFGKNSLYQYINRTTSEHGNNVLASWLLAPGNEGTILERQEAVKELSQKTEWRQQLQSYGMSKTISIAAQEKIEVWLQQPLRFINSRSWQVLRFLLPFTSISLLIFHLSGILSSVFFYPLIFGMLVISLIISRSVTPSYIQLDKITQQLESLSDSIGCIEQGDFKSKQLSDLQKAYNNNAVPASASIHRLKRILDMLDIRLNPLVFLPLNTFLSWDLQQVFALEKWKQENKQLIHEWFENLATTEAVSSLATLSFNHTDWVFPVITDDKNVFKGKDLGHPLIPPDKCVLNSFFTETEGQLNLVTGSNMAGKSTFLRTVGINIVLSMMGAPVYASSLTLSHMKVMSSMRISDNLEENTSTFYAELKNLKKIIEAVYAGQPVFLLLDEILRGTNSADRHTGSKALVKQLIDHNAAGLIATHDLELAKLADDFPGRIYNYHFDVQVSGEDLYFDYKLKGGICQSMNASILMKKIGIEI